MAYFPHAYQKMFVATAASNPFTSGNGTLTTTALTAGQVSIVNSKTNKLLDLTSTPTYATTPMVYLAQGSFHTTDKLGPHGGYQETVKSKGINPKYVSKFYVVEPAAMKQNIVDVSGAGCQMTCGTTYRLRVDIKGSPALRFLTHNLYRTLDAYTGCCAVEGTVNYVDQNVVFLQWADQLNEYPTTQAFVQAKVWNLAGSTTTTLATTNANTITLTSRVNFQVGARVVGAGIPDNTYVTVASGTTTGVVTLSNNVTVASGATIKSFAPITTATYTPVTGASIATQDSFLELTGAYVDTVFGNCSFAPTDHVEYQPIQIYTSVTDDKGNPCLTTCFTTREIQGAYQGKGYGETLVRELILDKRYRQEPWEQDPRMREVLNDTTLTEIDRTKKDYYTYHILHSVPRKANPSSTMDNDQYLIKIVCAARNANFETYLNTLLTSSGNDVQLEVLV